VGTDSVIGPWFEVETSTPRAISGVILGAQTEICSGQQPSRILIAGSIDGVNWTQLFTSTSDITWDSDTNTFTFQNTTVYRYVRLIITKDGNNVGSRFTELEYFYTPDSATPAP
jgi:hypothetical protein